MAKKRFKQGWMAIGIVIIIVFALLYTQTSIFQSALNNYDFVHYIELDGQSTDSLMFGSSQFAVSAPKYSAFCDQDMKTNAPSPSIDCWTATAVFEGQSYTLPYGEDVEINDWLTVKWQTDAMVDNGELEDYDRTDSLSVKFDADKAIEFSATAPDMTLFGTDAVITLQITNNMPTINSIVEIEKESRLLSLVDTFAGETIYETYENSIHTGISTSETEVNLPNLGQYSLSVSLIPVLSYSGGEYKESTTQQIAKTTVVSQAMYSGQITEEETVGKAIPVFDSITTTAANVPFEDYIMMGIIVLLSIILVYMGFKVFKKYR